MKLHGNAALSWSGRRLLARACVRVRVGRLTAAAEAAGVSVRCARKWVDRYRAEGEAGLADRSSAPHRVANRTPAERVAVIVALRQLRMTAAEIAETLGMPLSTVSAVLKRQRPGPARPDRARAGCPLRALTAGRARPHRRQKARPDRGRRRQTRRLTVSPGSYRPRQRRRVTAAPRHRSAGSTSTSPSTTTAASPTPKCSPTRKPRPRSASSRRALAFFGRHGIRVEGVLTDNGSRLPRNHPRARLPTHSASATAAHAPTGHKQTAKPNASSAPCSTAGPTARSTAQATNEPEPLTAGSGTTTIDGDTQPSATNPRPG